VDMEGTTGLMKLAHDITESGKKSLYAGAKSSMKAI